MTAIATPLEGAKDVFSMESVGIRCDEHDNVECCG